MAVAMQTASGLTGLTVKPWVARVALFKAPLGLPLGLPDCPGLNLVIAVFPLFFQKSIITYCP